MDIMKTTISISFPEEYSFSERSIKFVDGIIGIYFIYLGETMVRYPFRASRLIYIGMSELRQNSIGNRLRGHLTGQSGNLGLMNYGRTFPTKFTYQSMELLRALGTTDLFELESFFLSDFLTNFGCFPICNGQSGAAILKPTITAERIIVRWDQFGS